MVKRTYSCWNSYCESKTLNGTKRIEEKDLIKEVQDIDHIDYLCPYCNMVIICEIKDEKS